MPAPERRAAVPAAGLIHCSAAFLAEDDVVAVVWNFEIVPDQGEAFESFYGADGEWTKISRRSRSFLGSSFLKDLAHPERYLLVEYWSEMLVYEKHLVDFDDEMHRLEEQRERFVVKMEALGVFSALDVPDRVGPTWSRRSG
jgi:hypothetical protein